MAKTLAEKAARRRKKHYIPARLLGAVPLEDQRTDRARVWRKRFVGVPVYLPLKGGGSYRSKERRFVPPILEMLVHTPGCEVEWLKPSEVHLQDHTTFPVSIAECMQKRHGGYVVPVGKEP